MSQIDDQRTVADRGYLDTLPPPPAEPAPVVEPARPRGRVWKGIADRLVRVGAAAAGLSAGPRRPPASRTRPAAAPPEPDETPAEPDPALLAKLPPPPAEGTVPVARSRVDIVVLDEDDPADRDAEGDHVVIYGPPAGAEPWGATVALDPDTEETPVVEAPREPAFGFVRSRYQRRREWRRVERARRHAARHSVRFPIFTRSILLWMLIFALIGTTAGGTAAVFWTHFNTQIAELREDTQGFDKRSQAAEARLGELRDQAVGDIDKRMQELSPALAEPRTVQAGAIISPYVWFVTTLDENGVASVGTAFSVASDDRSTWLITSFNVVKAGTTRPAPPIVLRKDPDQAPAELVSWDTDSDLALLRMDRGGQPVLAWATEDVQAKLVGTRVYVVTGFGGSGATLNAAMAIDQNAKGLLHDGRVGTAAQGGPMVTTDGRVVAVASLAYQPLGFTSGELHYAPSIRRACDVLLSCTTQTRRVRAPNR